MSRPTAALLIVAMLCAACGLTAEVDDGGAGGPATTSPVTTSPVTTSQDPSPVTTSPATTSPVTTSQDPSPVTTSPVTTSPPGPDLPESLEGYGTTTIRIGDRTLIVAVADTSPTRSQGLMFVSDLGDLDGMLFVWPDEREGTFWMKNTVIPLDIAWFDGTGVLVGALTMTPCVEEPCERYSPGAPYRYAVETAEGDLDFVGVSTRLVVEDP